MDNSRYYGGHNSNGHGSDDPGQIPDRWLHCPRNANAFITEKFFAFKTPLSVRFSPKMDRAHNFTPEMVFSYMKMEKVKKLYSLNSGQKKKI